MKNIVLIGFMGTGKTSTGRLLASRLGCAFVDTDQKVEEEAQMSVGEIFARYGEPHFRALEAAVVQQVARSRQTVISTGGGVVLQPENMRALRERGAIVALTASVDTILERTSRRHARPLLEQEDRRQTVEALLSERRELYRQADLMISTDGITPLQAANQIINFIRKGGV